MTEQHGRLRMSDFLDLPNGREEFAKHMLDLDKRDPVQDTRFTDDENLELFRIQFDRALLSRKLESRQISPYEFESRQEDLNNKVTSINQIAKQRRESQS